MKVTIVYDVETVDKNLAFYLSDGVTQGSTVENTITKTISNFGLIEAGKKYILKLHLGMRSVDFDAEVTEDWSDTNGQADLPSNLKAFEAGKAYDVTVPAAASTYQFAITGLPANDVVTAGSVSAPFSSATSNNANASGVAIESIDIAANTTVKDITAGSATWNGTTTATTLNFTQKAGALGLSVAGVNKSTKKITLASTATDTPLADGKFSDMSKQIKVTKNGTPLVYNGSPAAGQFSYANGEITFFDDINTGETYKIYVQAGDADAETVTITIGAYDVAMSSSPLAISVPTTANTYTVVIRGAKIGGTTTITKTTDDDNLVASVSVTPSIVGANSEVVATFTTNAAGAANKTATITVEDGTGSFVINLTQTVTP